MAVPKTRTSHSKRNMRRSHHALKVHGVSICANCSTVKPHHGICDSCGHYRGKQWLEPKKMNSADTNFSAEG
jgi:large subunit ribosomal protein L32